MVQDRFHNDERDIFGDRTVSSSTSIGDEMLELTDAQIERLIQVRFGSNPLLLIRQLSRDVASKEKQLILLRNDKFQREHELIRLCAEYSNLTTLEIESRLSTRVPDDNIERALGEMVGLAVNEAFTDDAKFNARSATGTSRAERPRRNKENPNEIRALEKNKTDTKSEAHTSDRCRSESAARPLSPDTNTLLSSTSTAESSSIRGYWHDWSNISEESVPWKGRVREDIASKPPVEMEKIASPSVLQPMASPSGAATDKHGFYLNTSEVKKGANDQTHAAKMESEPSERLKHTLDKLKQLSKMHDAENESIQLRWDKFMARITEEQLKLQSKMSDIKDSASSAFGFKASNLKRSDTGWARYFASKKMESPDKTAKFDSLKSLIQEDGIPPKYRNQLWMELSGAKDIAVPGEYGRLLEESYNSSNKSILENIAQVNLDLHRTLPSNIFFHDVSSSLPGPQLTKLQRILYAVVVHSPDTGYSQGMNKIVGNLLIGVSESNAVSGSCKLEEEDVFWIFVALIDDIIPAYNSRAYFESASISDIQLEVHITAGVYFKKFVPKLQAHFSKIDVDVQVVLYGWWLSIFSECTTSVDTWFKFVDSLLISDNSDIKFIAFSLATLKVHETMLLDCGVAQEAYCFFNRLKQGAVTNVRFKDLNKECNFIEAQISASELLRRRAE